MVEILKILITILSVATVSNGERTANMICFEGTADSPYFQGTTLDGGVDTQFYSASGGSLSARYMLRGVDCNGDSCSIFIQNEAVVGEPTTHPSIITDSKALNFLNSADLIGTISGSPEGLVISIGTKAEEAPAIAIPSAVH